MSIRFTILLLLLDVTAFAQQSSGTVTLSAALASVATRTAGTRNPAMDAPYRLGADSQKQPGVPEGNWKYRQAAGSQAELFDLDLDPAEQYNVWERHRDVAGALEGQDADVCARGGGDVGVRKRS